MSDQVRPRQHDYEHDRDSECQPILPGVLLSLRVMSLRMPLGS